MSQLEARVDAYDWRGCSVVHHDPRKLGGSRTVFDTRLDADTVWSNFANGMPADEIAEDYQTISKR